MSKGDLKRMMLWAADTYTLPVLSEIASAAPTAELRPIESTTSSPVDGQGEAPLDPTQTGACVRECWRVLECMSVCCARPATLPDVYSMPITTTTPSLHHHTTPSPHHHTTNRRGGYGDDLCRAGRVRLSAQGNAGNKLVMNWL